MSDYFLLDPDYQDFPEKRKLKFLTVYGEQHTSILLVVIGLIFSGSMFLAMLSLLSQEWTYLTRNEETQGVVKASCQPNHRSYTYAFEVVDTQGNKQQYIVETSQYKNDPCPSVGTQITVKYLPDSPSSTARYIPEGSSDLLNIFGMGIALLFSLIFVCASIKESFAFLRACTQYPPLRQTILTTEGHIVAVKDSKDGHIQGRTRGAYCVEVEYEFIINNQRLTGKQVHRRNDLRDKPLPPPGTPVRILYADENTYVML